MANDDTNSTTGNASDSERLKMLKIAIWPVAALLLAVMFQSSLSQLIFSPGRKIDFEVGPGTFKIISDSVTSAAQAQVGQGAMLQPGVKERAEAGAKQTERVFANLQGRSILWIDDHPENNVDLQNAFAEAGIRVFNVFNNSQAQELLAQRDFDLAITDVGRDVEGPDAGLALLPMLHAKGIATIVYSARWAADQRGNEEAYKVFRITNDPTEVFSGAIAALTQKS